MGRDLVRGVWIKVARGMHLGRWGLGEVGEEDGVMEQGRRQSLGFYGFAQRGARRADNTDRTLLLHGRRVIVATTYRIWGTLQRGQIPKKALLG